MKAHSSPNGAHAVCGTCYWYSTAVVDGTDTGVCNYGSGREPPFAVSPLDHVQTTQHDDPACEHYERGAWAEAPPAQGAAAESLAAGGKTPSTAECELCGKSLPAERMVGEIGIIICGTAGMGWVPKALPAGITVAFAAYAMSRGQDHLWILCPDCHQDLADFLARSREGLPQKDIPASPPAASHRTPDTEREGRLEFSHRGSAGPLAYGPYEAERDAKLCLLLGFLSLLLLVIAPLFSAQLQARDKCLSPES